MYQTNVKRRRIPDNYNGTAFSPDGEKKEFIPPPTDCEYCAPEIEVTKQEDIRSPLPRRMELGLKHDDLLLIGLIILLSQSENSAEILPALILLLLF